MAHLDLANLRTTLLDDTQLAAVALHRTFAGHLPVSSGHRWSAIRWSGRGTRAG
ncbi:hypothetical protein NMB32_20555 [Stenotrophomonas sp. CD2]|nr:hypothetical protein NMB32_20555 [Stenotrophomonas sp. CD2]